MLTRKERSASNLSVAPARRRVICTDVPCLLLLITCIGALGYVAFLAMQPPSDIRRVLYGLDSQHDLCGVDNGDTGESRTVQVTLGRPTFLQRIWPFGEPAPPRNITVLRGARDHTARPLLYFTFPTGDLGGFPSAAVCVSACPQPPLESNATETSPDDPASYVCTGRYYGTATDRCPAGSAALSPGCEAPPASALFSEVGAAELARCEDPAQECTVCYPPYRTVQLATYCLPDPKNALDTFSNVITAFGAVGASTDGSLSLEASAPPRPSPRPPPL